MDEVVCRPPSGYFLNFPTKQPSGCFVDNQIMLASLFY